MTNDSGNGITIWQKLDFLPGAIQILIGAVGSVLAAPFRGQDGHRTFKRHVTTSVMRQGIARFSPAQLQWVTGTAGTNYAAWTKAQKIQPQSVDLPNVQTSAYWIGDPSAEVVGLYFHGGGFAVPASEGQFNFLKRVNSTVADSGKSLAFLLVQYDLAPAGQYPRQLNQCVELVRYAVTNMKKSPKQLILGGDSAGGSLVFGTLLHVLHPHPQIEPLKLSQPLRAAFASSPWLDFDMNSDRFKGSDAFDAASVYTLRIWADNYVGSSKSDMWREPAKAEAKDWKGLRDVVDDVLVTIAKKEVMADDVKRTVGKIQNNFTRLQLFEAVDDFHAEPVLGSNTGVELCEAAKIIASWAAEKC